nr:MAG TPA: hypothetical protein [Caudoviricetes sp.]
MICSTSIVQFKPHFFTNSKRLLTNCGARC